MTTTESQEKPPTFAIVELMGHVKTAGRLSEEERFGVKMGRLDVPNEDGTETTVYFGGASVYRITVVTEGVARHVAKSSPARPVSPWDFPKQLPLREPQETASRVYEDCGHTVEDCDCDPPEEDDDRPF